MSGNKFLKIWQVILVLDLFYKLLFSDIRHKEVENVYETDKISEQRFILCRVVDHFDNWMSLSEKLKSKIVI